MWVNRRETTFMIQLISVWNVSLLSVEFIKTLPTPVLVGVGGSLGAICRFGVDRTVTTGHRSIIAVNIIGSAALGAVLAMPLTASAIAIFGTGVCGAFTTFSSHAVSLADTIEEGNYLRVGINITVTLIISLTGVGVGQTLGGIVL
ncbi:MAG: integral membrane protein possibly involved in chromosome condensation [Haloquadratum walsbyi J07HQW2]|uniref:Fluoride-specific ion channel FluC n=2 Tax=Haloquadratum walsbyi TaxID=293091 RepID=U1MXS1_9EURY|nr:MAG: integral membrane protein possibly involved in chromosome condensation [Haloquadratum walsbyi J07HQW2]